MRTDTGRQRRYRQGFALMWGGVGTAVFATLALPAGPALPVLFAAASAAIIAGAMLRRHYCPRRSRAEESGHPEKEHRPS